MYFSSKRDQRHNSRIFQVMGNKDRILFFHVMGIKDIYHVYFSSNGHQGHE